MREPYPRYARQIGLDTPDMRELIPPICVESRQRSQTAEEIGSINIRALTNILWLPIALLKECAVSFRYTIEQRKVLLSQLPAKSRLGRYVAKVFEGETVRAFVPPPLPPVPSVRLDRLQLLLEQANQAVGRLDGLASLLPDLSLLLYTYVRKEAVLSSQIEGTQSSLSDLLLFENEEIPGAPIEDVQEVSNYVAAMNHGLERLRAGFPLSLRLIREIHEILLSNGRGSGKQPGEFRRSQNWIGGSRPGNAAFVPPPPELVEECLGQLESPTRNEVGTSASHQSRLASCSV